MAKASPALLSFSAGELSKLFDSRIDLEEYPTGCRVLENFIPLIQGPAMRRGGTRFVRAVKDSTDRCGFIRFEFNTEQAYVLEIGDQYMRFYTDHGIVMNGTAPLELATPWTAANLFDADGNFLLRSYIQSGDITYICHTEGDYAPQKLTRSGALSWSIATFVPEGGPFEDVDPDETITVYASASTGSVTLTASSAIFTSAHIGGLFLLEQKAIDDTLGWEAGKAVSINDIRRMGYRNYQALNSATTGGIIPSHTEGAMYDGNSGVQWQYLDAGLGWGTIAAINSAGTGATLTVDGRIPTEAVGSGNASTRWAFGAWSASNGWPTHVTFFRERLVFARSTTREFWMSEAGDFERFRAKDGAGETVADSAIRGEVTSDTANRIEWMAPADRLMIGTAGGEFAIGEITGSEPLGPGNVKADPNSSYGSRPVSTVKVGDSVIFVQRSGRKVRDLAYTFEKEKFVSSNLNVLSPHLFQAGKYITAMAYQQEPHSVIWALRSDGKLMAATINANQKRFGWHRHPIGGDGIVEAIETIPSPDGDSDELWMIVRRTISGATVRYIEFMEPELPEDSDIIEAFYLDSGLTYNGAVAATLTPGTGATVVGTTGVTFTAGSSVFTAGDVGREIWYRYQNGEDVYHTARAEITAQGGTTATCTIIAAWPSLTAIASGGWRKTATAISGLNHLEGKSVQILADGSTHPNVTVSGGAITLDRKATYVHVGLACDARIKTMRIEAGAQDGTAQGKLKRIHRMIIRMVNTLGGSAGAETASSDAILFRTLSDLMDEPVQAYSGDKELNWPQGYSTDAWAQYENTDPLPATITGFMPQLHTQDR